AGDLTARVSGVGGCTARIHHRVDRFGPRLEQAERAGTDRVGWRLEQDSPRALCAVLLFDPPPLRGEEASIYTGWNNARAQRAFQPVPRAQSPEPGAPTTLLPPPAAAGAQVFIQAGRLQESFGGCTRTRDDGCAIEPCVLSVLDHQLASDIDILNR